MPSFCFFMLHASSAGKGPAHLPFRTPPISPFAPPPAISHLRHLPIRTPAHLPISYPRRLPISSPLTIHPGRPGFPRPVLGRPFPGRLFCRGIAMLDCVLSIQNSTPLVGIDLGSTTAKLVLVEQGRVTWCRYERHLSKVR